MFRDKNDLEMGIDDGGLRPNFSEILLLNLKIVFYKLFQKKMPEKRNK